MVVHSGRERPGVQDGEDIDAAWPLPCEPTLAAASADPPRRPSSSRVGSELLAGRYRIEALLGEGGMGSVYRAHDLELDEHVALKLLHDDHVRSAEALARFRLEVKLARKVTHRNVARTFDIGEHDGRRFLTMELVRGESLAEILRRRPRPDLELVGRLVDDVASALAAAHEVGVVHRDLKPENVLTASDGRFVVTDFGIAHARAEAATHATDGALFGTPTYMAPEQVDGAAPIDARADVYALGAMLYEALVGSPAWTGATPMEVVLARLSSPPPRPIDARPALGRALSDVVVRALARRPEDRFPSMRAMRDAALEALAEAREPARSSSSPSSAISAALPRPRLAPMLADVAPSALGRGARTVAVMPFRNLGAEGDAYLAEGLTEDLTDALSMTRGLRVTARGTVARAAAGGDDPVDLGRALGVEVVVEGSVRKIGDTVRVNARVVSAEDGFQMWAERFDRPSAEVLVVSDHVAGAVAATLTVARDAPERKPPSDGAVVELYLRAKADYRKERLESIEAAIAHLEAAIALAPSDPQLLAAAALAHDRAAFIRGTRPGDHAARGQELARRAADVSPEHPEALHALGVVLLRTDDLRGAVRALRRCVERAPGMAEAQATLARVLLEVGDLATATRRLEAVRALDPDTRSVARDLARAYALAGRWAECDARVLDAIRAEGPGIPNDFLVARLGAWRRDEAASARAIASAEAAGHPEDRVDIVRFAGLAALRAATADDVARARRWLEVTATAVPSYRRLLGQLVTEAMAGAGAPEEALAALTTCVGLGLYDRVWLDACPLLEPLRGRGAFEALRAVVVARADEALRGMTDA
jgi:serine/threonine-protein kinase